MRPWSRVALTLAAVVCAAPGLAAQPDLVTLDKPHELLAANQPRAAARALAMVSGEFRGEIGRCRDETLGAKLMELEPRIDGLIARINAGTLTRAAELEADFAVIDRLLAENHWQLATTGWGLRRFGRLDVVAKDLKVAAAYAERAARWRGTPLDAAGVKVVAEARRVAEQLAADPANPPAETPAAIEALGKLIKQ